MSNFCRLLLLANVIAATILTTTITLAATTKTATLQELSNNSLATNAASDDFNFLFLAKERQKETASTAKVTLPTAIIATTTTTATTKSNNKIAATATVTTTKQLTSHPKGDGAEQHQQQQEQLSEDNSLSVAATVGNGNLPHTTATKEYVAIAKAAIFAPVSPATGRDPQPVVHQSLGNSMWRARIGVGAASREPAAKTLTFVLEQAPSAGKYPNTTTMAPWSGTASSLAALRESVGVQQEFNWQIADATRRHAGTLNPTYTFEDSTTTTARTESEGKAKAKTEVAGGHRQDGFTSPAMEGKLFAADFIPRKAKRFNLNTPRDEPNSTQNSAQTANMKILITTDVDGEVRLNSENKSTVTEEQKIVVLKPRLVSVDGPAVPHIKLAQATKDSLQLKSLAGRDNQQMENHRVAYSQKGADAVKRNESIAGDGFLSSDFVGEHDNGTTNLYAALPPADNSTALNFINLPTTTTTAKTYSSSTTATSRSSEEFSMGGTVGIVSTSDTIESFPIITTATTTGIRPTTTAVADMDEMTTSARTATKDVGTQTATATAASTVLVETYDSNVVTTTATATTPTTTPTTTTISASATPTTGAGANRNLLSTLTTGTSLYSLPYPTAMLYSTTMISSSVAAPSSSLSPSSLSLPSLSSSTALSSTVASLSSWPVKHASVMEGDVILGGLMMVHSREDSITCGPIMPQGGIQALEAMLYTLDQLNKQQLLPNVTLGAHILDDCDKDTYGLEMAVDFIKGSISNIDDAEYHCNKTQVRKVISGVVGAASSVTSIQVANLLRLFRIPQVSFFSTSPELSNKQRFEYFSRTIPSDHYQVKAMVEIVKRMGWSYVSIIYEESNYGIKAFEELEELLARHNICIAIKEKLVKDSGVAEEIAYDNIVQKLLTKPRARGAIIFGSDQEVREVMRAVRRNNATGAFSWIGSDGWSARNLVSDGNEPEVEGTLSVQPQANPVKGFEEYFLNLTVENNQRNPWFVEFWEDHFQCRYPGSTSTPYNSYNRTCTTKEQLLHENTDFEDQLQFVSDAVMAFAYALRDMHRDLCGGRPSLCDAMKPTKGADLLKYLRKVQFQGLSGDHFRFDGNGDGPARYNIIHFKQSDDGQYGWVKVGEYYEGELRLNMTEVQFKLLHPKPPESVCSLPCERGQAKKYVEGESCCWHCFNCSMYQIRHPIDETQCLTCQLGTLPDASKQFCQTIPEVYLRPESAWAIGAMAFSSTGILVTLFVVGVFVRHNDTPIVRASGRELSYILLAGILMCYAVTFALVLKPTNIVCAIQRFSVGFCFTVVYAALLTKTNRIARIFKAGKQSAKRPSFISPKSQLVICTFLIFIQILINGVWMVIAPSHAMYHHPTREDNLLVCDSYIDASYMIAFFYPILLIVVCTVYAVLTRKIPEAFNESKHIGFTMYTTCVIWLAFVPLYFGTANHVPLRITSMSVTISLSASVTIACLFSPKLYIILVRPERNVRQSMMPPRYGNMHRTAGTGPSSMMAAAVVTAATCAQEEKIQKHITPTNTEHTNSKSKKLCEMATQTIAITNIFANIEGNAYSQIPYADQYVPNNNQPHRHNSHQINVEQQQPQPLQQQQYAGEQQQHAAEEETAREKVVANNNKINQQQHGYITAAKTTTTSTAANGAADAAATPPAATTTTTGAGAALAPNKQALAVVAATAAVNGVESADGAAPMSNHIMLQQQQQPPSINNDCKRAPTLLTTAL